MIQKMQYEGESRNWNWDKHCEKFHHQIQVIDEWATAGLATCMSKEDKMSAFLKMIPKDCKNSELGITWGIIKGDRSWFPTLIGAVIPHLSLSIESREQGASDAKCTIANARSDPGWHSGKRQRTARSPRTTMGKLHIEGGKVVGTIEGLHYEKNIWMAMTKEQRDKAVVLHQAKSSQRVAKAATTSGSTVPISEVSDKIDKLARAVKSLDTKSAGRSRSKDHPSSSHRSYDRSRSGSSSQSCGSNQSGAHSGRRKC